MSTQMQTYQDAIMTTKKTFASVKNCPVEFEREARFALQVCEMNTALQNPSMIPSLHNAVRNVALCGITLNPAMKLAYLVPRKGKVCLDISYMGLAKIATDSGSITHLNCQLVYANDQFEIEHGTHERLSHKPDVFGDRGALIGVYVAATIHSGAILVETMSLAEVKEVQKRSKAANGPWITDFNEMMRKTCVKRASKYWPKTERLGDAINTLNEHDGTDFKHSESGTQTGAPEDETTGITDITPYPEKNFKTMLPKWTEGIESGKYTAEDVAKKVSSKGEFTKEQLQTLKEIKCNIIDAEEV